MHPSPVNRVAIGRGVVYNARAAKAFSAGIKCRHCMSILSCTCCCDPGCTLGYDSVQQV